MSKPILALLGAVSLFLGSSAFAVSFTVQVGDAAAVDLAPSGNYYTDEPSGITFWWLELEDGTPVDPNNPFTDIAGLEITGMNAALKEDPFVTNNITFVNTQPFAQTFTVTVSLPIPAFAYDATIGSSIGVTVTDTVGGSVSADSVSPAGIYSGLVNGVTILTLMPDPTSVSCASLGCSNTLSDNGGVPQLAAGPGVATSIGIRLEFTLSAFDQVGITISVASVGLLVLGCRQAG